MSPSAALTIVSAKITNALASMFPSVLIHLTLITRAKADFNSVIDNYSNPSAPFEIGDFSI